MDPHGDTVGRSRPVLVRFLAGFLAVTLVAMPSKLIHGAPSLGWWDHLVVALVFLPLIPLVSYRRRDWLFIAVVPLWCFVVAARVGWPAANQPVRDWPPTVTDPGYRQWLDAEYDIRRHLAHQTADRAPTPVSDAHPDDSGTYAR